MNVSILPSKQSLRSPVYWLPVAALAGLVCAIVCQDLTVAAVITLLPAGVAVVGYGLLNPRLCYLAYAVYVYYFIAIMRYTGITGLSVVLDILLIFILIAIGFAARRNKNGIRFKNAVNTLTVSYSVWMVFILLQFLNPGIHAEGIVEGLRRWMLGPFFLYIIASLLSDSPRMLRNGLILWGVLTITAFLKLLWQRFYGFDSAEIYLLYDQGMARTHIISSGIRYFSLLSDAANFGTNMAMAATVYSLVGFNTRNRKLAFFYLTIAAMGVVGTLLSGTRGALVIPFSGLILFSLLAKNLQVFVTTAMVGIVLFALLALTDIGNDNSSIRRARTAFHPSQDRSYNVRLENRKEIADYLKSHPWGVGIAENIPKLWQEGDTYTEGTLPADSYMVSIWIQTGPVGLVLYLLINIIVLLRSCYIILFQIKDKQLKLTLAALTCTAFGTIISGYAAYTPGMPPTNFLTGAMLAFVMNGQYLDRQITPSSTHLKQSENV